MSVAASIRRMMDAGLTIEQALIAVEAVEAEQAPVKSSAAIRQARYRERKRNGDVTTATERNGDACYAPPSSLPKRKVSPCTPSKENNPPSDPEEGRQDAGKPAPLPVSEAFDAWNEMAAVAGLANVRERTDGRVRHLRTRLASSGLAGWVEAMQAVARSPFLVGNNDRGWKATFDWVCKAENFAKIREGSYDRPSGSNVRLFPSNPAPAEKRVLTPAEAYQEILRKREANA